jgi:hypothetical protein
MSFDGVRYLLLLMVPLSIAAGAAVGRLAAAVSALSWPSGARARGIASIAAAGALVAAVVAPVAASGISYAYRYHPSVSAAWDHAFAAVRRNSERDAIVDIWWDYGHWAKYFTKRPVNLDGASLLNSTVRWTARALLAPTDAGAIGLLRMLNCGAVTDPETGIAARPDQTLRRWGVEPALAFRTLMTLAPLAQEQSPAYLQAAGLGDARAAALSKVMYCTPAPSFLVLSTELFDLKGFMVQGFWDPGRAYAVDLARRRYAADAAAPVLAEHLGLTEPAARDLYAAASQVRGEDQREIFAAPDSQIWSRAWQPCTALEGGLHCTLDLLDPETGVRLLDLVIDLEHPERARIRILKRPMGAPMESAPALVEIADPDRLRDIAPPDAGVDLGVLVDPAGQRVFVARPGLVRSTLVRLALLDGRYSPQFQRIFDQLDVDRRRITVWRIVWDRQP